jgi:hypothetical protein
MGQLLVPAMIGGGIGALGGAVSGNNPFKSALLGAGLGAGGAGLMGAGAAGGSSSLLSGLKGVEAAVPSLGSGGYAALGQNALGPIGGAATGGINFGSISSNLGGTNLMPGSQGINLSQYANPLTNVAENSIGIGTQGLGSAGINLGNVGGADITRLAVNTPLSLGEQFTNMIGNPFTDLTSRDKLGLGLQGASMLSQPQQMIQPSQGQISRPQFDPSSTLVNVAPNVNPQDKPLTEEELLRLQQMLQTTGFRGR